MDKQKPFKERRSHLLIPLRSIKGNEVGMRPSQGDSDNPLDNPKATMRRSAEFFPSNVDMCRNANGQSTFLMTRLAGQTVSVS